MNVIFTKSTVYSTSHIPNLLFFSEDACLNGDTCSKFYALGIFSGDAIQSGALIGSWALIRAFMVFEKVRGSHTSSFISMRSSNA